MCVCFNGVHFIFKHLIRIYCDNTPSKVLYHWSDQKSFTHVHHQQEKKAYKNLKIHKWQLDTTRFHLLFVIHSFLYNETAEYEYICEVGSQSAVLWCRELFLHLLFTHSLTSSTGSRSHSLSQPLSLSSWYLSSLSTASTKDIAVKVKSDF